MLWQSCVIGQESAYSCKLQELPTGTSQWSSSLCMNKGSTHNHKICVSEKQYPKEVFLLRNLLRNSLWQVWEVSQKFSGKKTSFWILFLRNKYLVICVLPLLVQSEKDLVGGSSWRLLELTSVSRFLAYVTHPHEWRISVAGGKKGPLWGKKCLQPTPGCND